MPFSALFKMHDTLHTEAADEFINLMKRPTRKEIVRQRMRAMRRRKQAKVTFFVYK